MLCQAMLIDKPTWNRRSLRCEAHLDVYSQALIDGWERYLGRRCYKACVSRNELTGNNTRADSFQASSRSKLRWPNATSYFARIRFEVGTGIASAAMFLLRTDFKSSLYRRLTPQPRIFLRPVLRCHDRAALDRCIGSVAA